MKVSRPTGGVRGLPPPHEQPPRACRAGRLRRGDGCRIPGLLFLVFILAVFLSSCSRPSSDGGGKSSTASRTALTNLRITSATVEQVANPASCNGSTICLIVAVENSGTVDAKGLQDGCGTSSFGDPEPWASYTVSGTVPAGSAVTFRSGFDNLGPYLPATFILKCEVDAAGKIAESDEGDNSYSRSITLG